MKRIGIAFVLFFLICSSSAFAEHFYNEESYSFVSESSGAEVVMLKDCGDSIIATVKNNWGSAKSSRVFALLNGRKLYTDIPADITGNMKQTQWNVFGKSQSGMMSIPDTQMAEKYKDLLNLSKTGLNKDSVWSFYENIPFGKDTEDFDEKQLSYQNDKVILDCDGSLTWGKDATGVKVGAAHDKEIVIAFTAPSDGIYAVTTEFAATETGDGIFRITKSKNGYIFDGELVKAFYINDTSYNTDIQMQKGDRIFFHLLPGDYSSLLNIDVLCASVTYSLYNDIDICENKMWLSDLDGTNYYMYDLDSDAIGYANSEDELYIKPVFYLNKKYFKENRLDIKKSGKAVLGMIRNSFEKNELGIYNKNEIEAVFNDSGDSFTYSESKKTDENGNEVEYLNGTEKIYAGIQINNNTENDKEFSYVVALYSDGRLLKIEESRNIIGAYSSADTTVEITVGNDADTLKTFLWDGNVIPLSELYGEYISISLENTEDRDKFTFYKSVSEEMNPDNWSLIETKNVNGQFTLNYGFASAMFWQDESVCMAMQNDLNSTDGMGEIKAVWEVPRNGNWKFSFEYRNLGTDVFGGDGGRLRLDCMRADGSVYRIRDIMIPLAFAGDVEWLSAGDCIFAGAGDKIVLSVNAGMDGFADRWEVKYKIEETNREGRNIFKSQEFGELSDVGIKNGKKGTEIKDKAVWLAMDSGLGDTSAGRQIIDYYKSYVPNMGVIYSTSRPEQYSVGQDYFINNSIPLMAQGYGQQYLNYFDSEHAFEYGWDDTYLSSANHPHYLAGSGHAVSMPHYAFTEAFGRFIKAAADNGFSAAGYCDYVWAYCEAMGSCRNPETKKAFVEDLTCRDSGLRLAENKEIYNFWDYYEYYFGKPNITPGMLGLASWEEYEPITAEEYNMMTESADRYFGLQDLLVHYETLKAAQFLSDTAIDEGIEFQIMPNPEWSPDGNDFLFLNKLDGMGLVTNEYFSSPSIVDGAYQRYDYLSGNGESSWGAVMEAGGGGTSGGYYMPEIAYLLSYEIGASGAEHMECDFAFNTALDSLKYSSSAQRRDTQLLCYAMGYSAAVEDNLKKREPDFTVVSDRQIVRPLMNKYIWIWEPWDLWLKQDLSVDFQLYKMGYRFNSISQEGIKEITDTQKLVFYSADVMTTEAFDGFLNNVRDGKFQNAVISAHSLKYTGEGKSTSIVDSTLQTRDFGELYPDFSYRERAETVKQGYLTDSKGQSISGNKVTLSGKTYRQMTGDTIIFRFKTDDGSINPAVVKRTLGKGTIYVLLFDPSADENYELACEIYGHILGDMGIERQWISVLDEGSYIGGYSVELDENGKPLQQTTITDEYGASVRIYESDKLTVAGVQNSLSRYVAKYDYTEEGGMVPYRIDGHTNVKIKMSPDTEYSYMAFPSGLSDTAMSDSDGYLTLEFYDTSHELFYIVESEYSDVLNNYRNRIDEWNEAITFGGRVDRMGDNIE